MCTKIPVACVTNAIPTAERPRWVEVGKKTYGAVAEVTELEDGYALRLPMTSEMLLLAAESVSRERLCCPFLCYELRVEPGSAGLWLRMRGTPQAKAFLRIALVSTDLLPAGVRGDAGPDVEIAAIDENTVDAVAAALNARVAERP